MTSHIYASHSSTDQTKDRPSPLFVDIASPAPAGHCGIEPPRIPKPQLVKKRLDRVPSHVCRSVLSCPSAAYERRITSMAGTKPVQG